jgi:integrase
MIIAGRYEEAARAGRAGLLAEVQARKVIGEIFEISNRKQLRTESSNAFFTRWLGSGKEEWGAKTYDRYSGIVRRFLEWLGPAVELGIQHLDSVQIKEYRDHLSKKHSAGSVNTALACIQAALSRAFRDALVDVNQAARVDRLAENTNGKQRRAFTESELKLILATANPEWHGMILVGVYTGARLGDVANLTWENIDLGAKEIHFRQQKTGKNLSIPIAAPLLQWLERQKPKRGPLFLRAFNSMQRNIPTGALSHQFRKILEKVGLAKPRTHQSTGKGRDAAREVGGLGFHCLRHSATTMLKQAGASDVVARAIVGHDSAAVSRTYSHIDIDTLRAAVNKLPHLTESSHA